MTWIDDRSRRSTPFPTINESVTAQQLAREPRTRGPRRGLAEQQALEITRDEIDLDVHRVAHREAAEVGLLQRVRREVHLGARAVHRVRGEAHAVIGDRHRSETDTIAGDAVTEARAAHIELAGVNADAHIAAAALQRGDMTHGLDDAGEHELPRSLTAFDARHDTPIVAHRAQLVDAQIDALAERGPLRQPKEAARSVAQQFGREINHQFVHPSLFE